MGSTSRVISNIVIFHPSFTNCVFAEECVREEEVWNFFLSQPRKSRLISCQISTFRGNKSQQFVKPFFFFYRLVRKTLHPSLPPIYKFHIDRSITRHEAENRGIPVNRTIKKRNKGGKTKGGLWFFIAHRDEKVGLSAPGMRFLRS